MGVPNDKQRQTKTPEDIPPVMLESDETSEMADEQCEAPPTPPQSDLSDDIIQPDTKITDSPGEDKVCGLSETPVSMPDEDNSSPKMTEVGKSRAARPYTFHFITGSNIRLFNSDTVALRYKGYSDGLVVATQPLHRGTSFRLRVDKISDDWIGTMGIGALAMLPTKTPPLTALYFTIPCWVVTEEILYSDGIYYWTDIGRWLDEITENSVLTLHFSNNSDLALEIDGAYRCVIATIPSLYNDIYPVIDVYGKVVQVSILHPQDIIGSTSPDLPMIKEKNSPNEDLHDVGPDSDNPEGDCRGNSGNDAVDQSDNSGDKSNAIDNSSDPTDDSDSPVEQYDPIPDHSSALEKPQGSDSPLSEDPSSEDSMTNPLSLGSHILDDDSDSPDEIEETSESNISHNDVYAEANANELYDSCHDNDGSSACDDNEDNIDNVFIDAMFLETSNMPDLDEDQSLSFDDSISTHSDDYYVDLSIENLRYLNSILSPDQREIAVRIDHPGRVFFSETNGNCEEMHVALKFWNQIAVPYSVLRDVVTSGNIHCFCHNCDPDADAVQSGWWRIEQAKPEERPSIQPNRMFWPVLQAMITSAPAINDANVDMRRPRFLFCQPSTVSSCVEPWIHEEGKPHTYSCFRFGYL